MLIEQVISELYKKYDAIKMTEDSNYEPKIEIYMDPRFRHECMSEIHGPVSAYAYEFSVSNTLMGYSVWVVPPTLKNGGLIDHPPFKIVNIDA